MRYVTKKAIIRSLVISIIFAAASSLISVTRSAVLAQKNVAIDYSQSELAKGLKDGDTIEYFEQSRNKEAGVELILHSFSYPGFRHFWLKAFLFLVVPMFLGCLTISYWCARFGV